MAPCRTIRVPQGAATDKSRSRPRGAPRQIVGGARGICGPRAVSLKTAGPPDFDSAAGRAAVGANAAIAGASEHTLGPVTQAGAQGHSRGSLAGRDGISAGSAACSLQIGAAGTFAHAACAARLNPESAACRAIA